MARQIASFVVSDLDTVLDVYSIEAFMLQLQTPRLQKWQWQFSSVQLVNHQSLTVLCRSSSGARKPPDCPLQLREILDLTQCAVCVVPACA